MVITWEKNKAQNKETQRKRRREGERTRAIIKESIKFFKSRVLKEMILGENV